MKHIIAPQLLTRRVLVHLIGCGGTGSQMLTGLARLHVALLALGHPYGLQVVAFDPDTVSDSNIGRQLFAVGDVGLPKAAVLINRINLWFGLQWRAVSRSYQVRTEAGWQWREEQDFDECDIAITCVDTAKARREIDAFWKKYHRAPAYHLDCANAQQTGQIVLCRGLRASTSKPGELPHLSEILPEIFNEAIPEDNRPSCSLAEALEEQGLYINQHVASWALSLLERLFRDGELTTCGYWINLLEGRVTPIPVPSPLAPEAGKKRTRKAATNG